MKPKFKPRIPNGASYKLLNTEYPNMPEHKVQIGDTVKITLGAGRGRFKPSYEGKIISKKITYREGDKMELYMENFDIKSKWKGTIINKYVLEMMKLVKPFVICELKPKLTEPDIDELN